VNNDQIRDLVVSVLRRIAPESDPAVLPPGASLRDELDLDSMDFLNFVLGLHERLGLDIPESDYPDLYTLEGAVAYLSSKATSFRSPLV
jgi:acyl carrier protein